MSPPARAKHAHVLTEGTLELSESIKHTMTITHSPVLCALRQQLS